MTPAPALTAATMNKMTVDELERLERFTSGTLKHHLAPGMTAQYVAALDLAKLALSLPPDIEGLVANLIAHGGRSKALRVEPQLMGKAADAILSLSARNRELEAENADMKISVIAFAGPFAAEHAKLWGLPKNHLFPTHYDILEKCGARMVDFVRADEAEIRAANLQGNGGEHE